MKKISTQKDTLSENLHKRVLEWERLHPIVRTAQMLADKEHAGRTAIFARPYIDMERPLDACDEPKT